MDWRIIKYHNSPFNYLIIKSIHEPGGFICIKSCFVHFKEQVIFAVH